MKILFLILALPAVALAQLDDPAWLATAFKAPAAGGGSLPSGDIISETFEGTGYSLADWVEDAGVGTTIDEDYTTTPPSDGGSQTLHLVQAGNNAFTAHDFTATGEVWGRLQFRLTSGNSLMLVLRDVGGDTVMFLAANAGNGEIAIYDGGNNQSATWGSAISTGTWYYLWFHWKKSPSPSVQLAISTTSTRPTWVSNTSGSSSTDAMRVLVGSASVNSITFDVDNLNLSSSDNL